MVLGVAMETIEEIRIKKQKVSGSAALNDKFQASGKFQMSYGSLSLFYGGLESLLDPDFEPRRRLPPATVAIGVASSRLLAALRA